MVHIAHSEGYSVMTHVNGADHIKVALEAGVDSIEHGNFMDAECLSLLKETGAVWCPTIAVLVISSAADGMTTLFWQASTIGSSPISREPSASGPP